jgi:hypothetical protein
MELAFLAGGISLLSGIITVLTLLALVLLISAALWAVCSVLLYS